MLLRKSFLFIMVMVLAAETPSYTSWPPPVVIAPSLLMTYPKNHAFSHETGRRVPYGWEAYYRIHPPGFLVRGRANGGDSLQEGTYQYDFYFGLKPGHLGGLLSQANDAFRIEVFDVTARQRLMDRTFQMSDFARRRRRLVRVPLMFSTWGRAGHGFEPRVFWQGLTGLRLHRIELRRLDDFSILELAQKAKDFEAQMDRTFLMPDGFVVVRDAQGKAEDLGDTALWTGLYAAAQAWRYQTTASREALQRMERSLWALHRLHAHSPKRGTLVRYVYPDGSWLRQAPSKDTYTGFFFAVAQCLPWVRNPTLQTALQSDVKALADHFLDHGLAFSPSEGPDVDLKPYLSDGALAELLVELEENPRLARQLSRAIRFAQGYFLIHGYAPLPALSRLAGLLRRPDRSPLATSTGSPYTRRVSGRPDRESLNPLLVSVLNDLLRSLDRLQRLAHRSANVSRRQGLPSAPYMKLEALLRRALAQVPFDGNRRVVRRAEDVKILASQALLALHVVKAAAESLPKPNRFERFYGEHLWTGEALLKTVTDWNSWDEDLSEAILGETRAHTRRRGGIHLSFLALFNLIHLERDPTVRLCYQNIFKRQSRFMRLELNAMVHVMEETAGPLPRQTGLALWALHRYPRDRRGKGEAYWRLYGRLLASGFGGVVDGKARDAIPADLRPRDAFLWQRNAHSLRGDIEGWSYPPLDYLFAYWLARVTVGINKSER